MEKLKNNFKLVIFDIDGTLLEQRSIFVFAEKFGFSKKLMGCIKSEKNPCEKSIEIASYLKGVNILKMLEIFRSIPLQKNAEKTIEKLREKNIVTALATDGYTYFANDLKNRLKINYAFANNLILDKNIVIGKVKPHNTEMRRCSCGKIYSICKEKVLEDLCKKLSIDESEVIAIGDGLVDIGMIKKAGLGIAYKAPKEVQKNADLITDDLIDILDYI